MIKKTVSLLLALIIALFAAAGCGRRSGAPETGIPEGTGPAQSETAARDETGPAPAGEAAPALWRVTDGLHTLYLFGTIHVGDERSPDALSAVRDVFDKCDALAVEFDSKAFENDVAASVAAVSQFLYTDGTTVRDHLPDELYEKSAEIIRSGGLYSKLAERYNLAMWSTLLDQAATARSGLSSDYGMDSLLLDRAYERHMEILEVESAEFQYGLLNSLPEELFILMIEETVEGIDEYADELLGLYGAWLEGDTDVLEESLFEDVGTEDGYTEEQLEMIEEYNDAMYSERNLGMAEKAVSYLNSGKTVFFSVGAAHMAGEGGLVKLLTDKGYEVKRLEPPYVPTENA